jgi:hypothetical protein
MQGNASVSRLRGGRNKLRPYGFKNYLNTITSTKNGCFGFSTNTSLKQLFQPPIAYDRILSAMALTPPSQPIKSAVSLVLPAQPRQTQAASVSEAAETTSSLHQPLAQPRQDVLAVDGKIYVETSPEQLLYEKRRMMAKQHQQPAWVDNLAQSAILGGALSFAWTTLSFLTDVAKNTWAVATHGERLKQHGINFLTTFAVSTAAGFLANILLQSYRNRNNQDR